MENKLLEQVVLGAPNFVGFIMLAIMLYRINAKLIEKWSDCERDNERNPVKAQHIED